jgi:hypothetical protein
VGRYLTRLNKELTMSASSTAMHQMTYEEQVRLMRAEAVVSMLAAGATWLTASVAHKLALLALPETAIAGGKPAAPRSCPCYGVFY